MYVGEIFTTHRSKICFPSDSTKVRHFFQIRKDLGNYFSSISLIFSMNVFARLYGINNLPLFVDKGMLSGDKVGLFFLEVTSMEEMNFLGRDELFWKR